MILRAPSSRFTDKLEKRPAFQQLLSDARRRQFEVVLVYKYDRFARKMRLYLQCIHDLEQLGVQVKSATEGDSWLEQAMSGMVAEQYRRMLAARMKDVRTWEARQGRLVGPAPVGYERRGHELVETPQASALRLAFELLYTGDYGVKRITDALNAAGYVNADGELFKVYAVEEMLKNPVYAGYVVCRGELYEGKHQPIWDATLWAQIQQVQAQRSRRRMRPAVKHDPLLAGLIYCANCGAAMWHNASGGRRFYRCCVAPSKRPGPIADIIIHPNRIPVQRQIAQATPAPARTLDIDRAMTTLSSMGAAVDVASPAQRRALLR